MKTDICIKLQLYVKLSHERFFIDDALLLCEGSEYKIIANINSKDAPNFSFRTKYWNDNMLSLKLHQEFSIKKAFLGDCEIKVRFNNTRLIGLYGEHLLHKNYATFVWKIDSFIYETVNDDSMKGCEIVCQLTKNASGLLKYGKKDISFQYKGIQLFLYIDEEGHSCIKCLTQQYSIIDEVLSLMSFYLRTPIEFRMIRTLDKKNISVEYKRTKYNIQEIHIVHSQFMYLNINNGGTFLEFVEFISDNDIEDSVFTFVRKGIDNYVRSNYLDNLSKYVLLYSVLAVFANKIHKYIGYCEYERIKKLFECFELNISAIDSVIGKKGFKDSNGNIIKNLAELRNEIMHGLPSTEIIRFLDNDSDVISRMEFVTCITILKELCFSNISFKDGFENLNVFKVNRTQK